MSEAFVYCWTDSKTDKIYVGWHKGSFDDGYICSSNTLLEIYNKRPNDFTRQIIATGKSNDMVALESAILKSDKASTNKNYYNMHNNDGSFYNKGHSELTKQKLKIARNKRIDKPRLGKALNEAGKLKASESAKRAALRDGRGKRLAENRGKGVNYSDLMKEVWRKRKAGLIKMPVNLVRGDD